MLVVPSPLSAPAASTRSPSPRPAHAHLQRIAAPAHGVFVCERHRCCTRRALAGPRARQAAELSTPRLRSRHRSSPAHNHHHPCCIAVVCAAKRFASPARRRPPSRKSRPRRFLDGPQPRRCNRRVTRASNMLPVTMHRLGDGEEQQRRDTMPGDHQAAHAAHSPTHTPFPPERARSSNPSTPAPLPGPPSYNQPASPPAQGALPPIASALYPRDPPPTTKYYDPTSDHAYPAAARADPRYNGHYPAQVCNCSRR